MRKSVYTKKGTTQRTYKLDLSESWVIQFSTIKYLL